METKPLLSDEDVDGLWDRFGRCVDDKVGMRSTEVRDFYEAARAEDAKLIQSFVDAMHRRGHMLSCSIYKPFAGRGGQLACDCLYTPSMSAAAARNFKPSQP